MSQTRPADAARTTEAAGTTRDPRWASVVARDPDADGRFFYSVRTTGVYCRPSCGARTPRPENVRFHADTAQAGLAGVRACRRCRPDLPPRAQRQAALVAQACRAIEQAGAVPDLETLARSGGLSGPYLHRVFKTVTGLTPRAYAQAWRARRLRDALPGAGTVTEAIYDAGYTTSSRFYAAADQVLGMTPKRYRAGAPGAAIRFAIGQCTLGAILVAASERGVCAILLGDDADALLRELQDRFPRAALEGGDPAFDTLVAQAVGLVESPALGADLPLDIRGTAFQQRVWQALRDIPPGTTTTYTALAQRLGVPRAVRAVAGACAANALAVAIPCHRVVRRDGGLAGYRWGIERKRALLAREAGRADAGGADA